jgi:hypothetical protein
VPGAACVGGVHLPLPPKISVKIETNVYINKLFSIIFKLPPCFGELLPPPPRMPKRAASAPASRHTGGEADGSPKTGFFDP